MSSCANLAATVGLCLHQYEPWNRLRRATGGRPPRGAATHTEWGSVGATYCCQNRTRMSTTSPFSFLESLASRFQPPAWAVDEGQHRLVLFLNHVLMQEKQAQERLVRQKGRVVHLQWGVFSLDLLITPAGLVD